MSLAMSGGNRPGCHKAGRVHGMGPGRTVAPTKAARARLLGRGEAGAAGYLQNLLARTRIHRCGRMLPGAGGQDQLLSPQRGQALEAQRAVSQGTRPAILFA